MNKIRISLYTNTRIGTIRKLNGGNLAPPITNENAGRNIRESFAALNIPLTRLHDAPLENAGARLVDIPMIFANFHADADDSRNYYFRQTDDYINNCIQLGTGIIYRLGTSIEHGVNKYFISPPPDIDKWIDISSNIIRHYNEGWAGGYRHNIQYWEIWNEPEVTDADGNALMWNASLEEFNSFYVKASKELKRRFPHLKFGGPAHCWWGKQGQDFVTCCAFHQAPLDFYSYHCYADNPAGWIVESPVQVRNALDAAGYVNTEIHLNEWHYFPGDWKRLRSDSEYKDRVYEEMRGLDSAAFLCAVQSRWEDTPLDLGCYYTVTTTPWGIYKPYGDTPTKSYYGMKAFGELVRYPERLKATSDNPQFTVLAGQDAAGRKALLIAGFKSGPTSLIIETDIPVEAEKCRISVIDDQHNLEEVGGEINDRTIHLEAKSSSVVFLLNFTP